MKHLSILLTVFFFSFNLIAQTTFAPPGSEWYQNMQVGIFHCYYAGDTIIDGTASREVKQEAIVTPYLAGMGLSVYDWPTLYFYNNADTVFVYNSLFNKFTPVYIFNVSPGDTVTLPMLPPQSCNDAINYFDSTFSFVVDSVAWITYDTSTLKTIFTHYIGNPDSTLIYNYGGDHGVTGGYAEKLGCINTGLLPFFINGINLVDESCESEGSIRCYYDSTTGIKLISSECGLPDEYISAISKNTAVSVYPNPAADHIHILLRSAGGYNSMQLMNMAGENVIYTGNYPGNSIDLDVTVLPAGVYLLKVFTDNGVINKKVSVVH